MQLTPNLDREALRKLVPLRFVLDTFAPWPRMYPPGPAGRGPCPVCTRSKKNRWFTWDGERWECGRCKRSGDVLDLFEDKRLFGGAPVDVLLCRLAMVAVPVLK